MARRSVDWNEELAKKLRNLKYAQGFILACIEEEIPLQIALGKVIRAHGIKEFSTKTKIPSPNILRAINPKHNPSQATLEKLLKPFKLKLTVTPIKSKKLAA